MWHLLLIIGFVLWLFSKIIGGNLSGTKNSSNSYSRTKINLLDELMVLTAAVMKANDIAKKSELEVVKTFLQANFSEAEQRYALDKLKNLLKDYNYRYQTDNACRRIANHTNYETRIMLMYLFFQICNADGTIDRHESNLLSDIRFKIGISVADFENIKRNFTNYSYSNTFNRDINTQSDYEILGITQNASDQEIKKAYRDLAKQYHPDKFASKSETEQKSAENKFKEINNAYENICKQRNIK